MVCAILHLRQECGTAWRELYSLRPVPVCPPPAPVVQNLHSRQDQGAEGDRGDLHYGSADGLVLLSLLSGTGG